MKEGIGQELNKWAKHSTLNLGQVLRHLRYLFDLPDSTKKQALIKRSQYALNDLLYTILPPQTHHSKEEIEELTGYSYGDLLKMGFDPDFTPQKLNESQIRIKIG